jgi:hypothetical protein
MAPLNGSPFLHQIPLYPSHDLGAEPYDVLARVVAARCLAFGVCGPAYVDDVDEGVGVAEVVEKSVA